MKRALFHLTLMIGTAAVAVGLVGCNDSTNGSSAMNKPTPEDSFELIVSTFRRGVEDIPVGFVVRREGGHSMMSGRKEVSHQLIPPAKKGDPYRGTITVDSEWKYSVQQSEEPAEHRKEEPDQQDSQLDGATNQNGLEILDPELVGGNSGSPKESRASAPGAERRVTRLPDENIRTYELLYQNGRWALMTELDPETEQSIERAFKKALDTQI